MSTNIYETVTIEKELITLQDIAVGLGPVTQKRPSGQLNLTKLNVTGLGGAYVVATFAELEALNAGLMQTKAAIVLETGQVYSYDGTKWVTASTVAYTVKTLEELVNVPIKVGVAVVVEPIRGGVFVYDDSLKDVNNEGTIVAGWKRQYDCIPNVRWFGAAGDGQTDDTSAIQAAIEAVGSVYLPKGTYRITSTLNLKERSLLQGVTGTTIKVDGRITGVQMATYAELSNIEFEGKKDLEQVGVLIDGGASENDVLKTKVISCNFKEVGGPAYKITNSASVGHSLVNCSISNCKTGVEVTAQGEGLEMVNTGVDNCDYGLKLAGAGIKVTNCSIVKNKIGVGFVAGDSGEAMTFISNCVIEDCTQSFSAVDTQIQGAVIANCSISDTISFVNADKFVFRDCDLSGAIIQFNNSNYNTFSECDIQDTNIVNDMSGSQTLNYFVDCTERDEVFEGGSVTAIRNTNFSIPDNGANIVLFNSVISNKMAKHENFSKYNFYDPSSGLFKLTNFATPGKTKIYANIQLCADTNDANVLHGISVYLYRVDSESEEINVNIDLHKVEAVLACTSNALPSGFSMFSFSGYIPRGDYKVVVYSNGQGGRNFLADGTQFSSGTGTVAFRARFSEI